MTTYAWRRIKTVIILPISSIVVALCLIASRVNYPYGSAMSDRELTTSFMQSLKAAMTAYHSDMGYIPESPGARRNVEEPVAGSELLVRMLGAPVELGGGPNSPYLKLTEFQIVDKITGTTQTVSMDGNYVERLPKLLRNPRTQVAFIDPYGNPIQCMAYHVQSDTRKRNQVDTLVKIWSWGPDGLDHFGLIDSDDIGVESARIYHQNSGC